MARRRALVLHRDDNVATAIDNVEEGEIITLLVGDSTVTILVKQAIPFGHKFALHDIPPRGTVIKYGQVIGEARVPIEIGQHVHVHNVDGLRVCGDVPSTAYKR